MVSKPGLDITMTRPMRLRRQLTNCITCLCDMAVVLLSYHCHTTVILLSYYCLKNLRKDLKLTCYLVELLLHLVQHSAWDQISASCGAEASQVPCLMQCSALHHPDLGQRLLCHRHCYSIGDHHIGRTAGSSSSSTPQLSAYVSVVTNNWWQ